MFNMIRRQERRFFAAWGVLVVVLVVYQTIRPDPTSAIVSGIDSESYTIRNHILRVYVSLKEFALRMSPEFRHNADNKAGTLQRGSLFFVSEESQGVQTVTRTNYPRANIVNYQFKRIEAFDCLERSPRLALVSEFMQLGEEVILQAGGIDSILCRSLIGLFWNCRSNGWDGKKAFAASHFGNIGDGLYYTELSSPSPFYNRKGRRLGTLEPGRRSCFHITFRPSSDTKTLQRFERSESCGRIRSRRLLGHSLSICFQAEKFRLQASQTHDS